MSPDDLIISQFAPITLEGLSSMELMQRHDTKYILRADQLPDLFGQLYPHYDILEIDGKRNFKYETMYYDTDNFYFYNQHHNQRPNRYKVRCRKYIDSQKSYFEVKFKDNKDKTIKNRCRLKTHDFIREIPEDTKLFAEQFFRPEDRHLLGRISPKLRVDYSRITLAGREFKERVTIDTNLTYICRDGRTQSLPGIVIAELKQEKVCRESPIVRCLRDMRILPANFSKYCMGVVLAEKKIKANRFKKKMLFIQKLNQGR